jgi:uncharacterized protein (DUF2147 family)
VALSTFLTALLPLTTWAQGSTPAGLWKNIDDATGKPRALIRIDEADGVLRGKIERVFLAPSEDQAPCVKCEGADRNAPVIGLVILSGLRKEGDEYVDGRILDPDSGNTYRCKVKLLDDGRKLSVRGYMGVPALGRTQTWVREE